MLTKNALIISDLHAPYQHPDVMPFLQKVKKCFGPFDQYYSVGDETDGHSWSFHDPEPGLANPDREFEMAKEFLKELYDFTGGKCILAESNHGSLAYRKARTVRIPNQIMKDAYQRALEAPPGWKWFPHWWIETRAGKVLLFHGFTTMNTWAVAKERGHSIITGHWHTEFIVRIEYVASLLRSIFAAQIGCLIDVNSEAYRYNAGTKGRPKLGVLVLNDGVPIPVAMALNDRGRWTGSL